MISDWPALLAYIDPGTAGAMFTFLAPILAAAAAVLGAVLWPFRWFFAKILKNVFRTRGAVVVAVIAIPVLVLAAFGAYSMFRSKNGPALAVSGSKYERVLMLGMDGLEPTIVEEMMAKGELPNFAKLKEQGSYARLATANPPESPVAWSCIATGRNPGKHGIFDFIHRDANKLIPYLSITLPNMKNYTGNRANAFLNAVQADPFWKYPPKEVPVNVVRWPGIFPPDAVSGHFFSGLGTPDVKGRQGAYTFYTTNPDVLKPSGRKNAVKIEWKGDVAETAIAGPAVQGITGRRDVEVKLTIKRRPGSESLTLQVGDAQPFDVPPKKWSTFQRLKFKLGALQGSLPGMVKFYLDGVQPELRLYASPVHIDPLDPAYPFTSPPEYAKQLAEKIGDYHTLGMPEIVHALSDGCYGPEAFLEECATVTAEREKMLDLELESFQKGLLAFVFDTSDRVQHMFWVTRDEKHPMYNKEFAQKYGHVIPDMYKEMDRVLGKVLSKIDNKTALLVLSDHGFNSFRRSVNLNSWFIRNGYMKLKDNQPFHEDAMIAQQIDWTQTKAFATGFASIYLNVKGREAGGIVDPKDVPQLCEELSGKLREFRDPKDNAPVVRNVYATSEIFRGPEVKNAPDMIVGFEAGYRAGWQMALGGSAAEILEDNMNQWCGDHLIDYKLVPGILFSNHKLKDVAPRLIDISPTILSCLGIEKLPADLDGESLLAPN